MIIMTPEKEIRILKISLDWIVSPRIIKARISVIRGVRFYTVETSPSGTYLNEYH
jgi:hypothetical protein